MARSRPLSIHLLKPDFDATNALDDGHTMDGPIGAQKLPPGSQLFLTNSAPNPPWWRDYLGIQQALFQSYSGALLFLPSAGRCFAICFGSVSHHLKDEALEYDFGLRVTLNIVDPNKIKATDVLEPDAARRQRTQSPIDSDITFFDFEQDSTVLQRLTGKVKDEYKELVRNATGAQNLRVNSAATAAELIELCAKLYTLYESDAYQMTFPNLRSVAPVRDPTVLDQLNAKAIAALRTKEPQLNLAIPVILDYDDNIYVMFSGQGQSEICDDLFPAPYFEYLESKGFDLQGLTIEQIKKQHRVNLTNEHGDTRESYSVFKCLIYDCAMDDASTTQYHLCGGHWYRVETDYLVELEGYLDKYFDEYALPEFNHENEADYNLAVADAMPDFVCLDTTSIAPLGQHQVEPCDLFTIAGGVAEFFHVKVSTLSARLSHLFHQGTTAIELLKLHPQAKERLEHLLGENGGVTLTSAQKALVEADDFAVRYVIITHKPADGKSRNLPLFSKISLRKSLRALSLMRVHASFGFVHDATTLTKIAKPKPKKTPPH